MPRKNEIADFRFVGEIAEPFSIVNDKINAVAVVGNTACPCFTGNQEGESNKCFRPQNIMGLCYEVDAKKPCFMRLCWRRNEAVRVFILPPPKTTFYCVTFALLAQAYKDRKNGQEAVDSLPVPRCNSVCQPLSWFCVVLPYQLYPKVQALF